MSFYPATVNFIALLMALACTIQAYSAPVNALAADKKNRTMSVKADAGVAQDAIKAPIVNNRRTMGISADGYYHPAPFTQKVPPRTAKNNERNVADKKPQNSAPDKPKLNDKKPDAEKNRRSKQSQSIVSIDQKKRVELSFGWPIKGRVLKSFSPSRNKGIDIVGKQGQSVKATEAGQVVYVGQGLIGFGKLLIIKHTNAYLSAYANTGRLLVKEGQRVDKGQPIAQVGDVGIKRTSLHFEIRKNGKPVNPFILLPKK